jgi:hypothetical protein
MVRTKEKEKLEEYPPLYEAFNLGDRVKRIYKDKEGKSVEYKGIVLAIDNNGIEIYWDTENGKYRPNNMNIAFTNCSIDEIFRGNTKYSPITRE